MKRIFCTLLFLVCSCFAVGQATPTLTPEQKINLYAAQHKLDGIQKQRADLDSQVQQITAQIKQRMADLTKQEADAKTAMEAAQKEAFKDSGAEESKFDLDAESGWMFKPKPTKAEAAPPGPAKDAQPK